MSKTPDTQSPLEAYTVAIETLMELCHVRTHAIKLVAAQELLQHVSVPPTVQWDYEEIEDE